jgi:hypothetical protein
MFFSNVVPVGEHRPDVVPEAGYRDHHQMNYDKGEE